MSRSTHTPDRPHHRETPRPHATDEQIALGILRSARAPGGKTKDFSSYLDRLSLLADRPVVLDAAISSALGSPHLPESEQRERAEMLKARYPEYAVEIDRTLWLNRMFDAHESRRGARETTDNTPGDAGADGSGAPAPDSVGPVLPDGSRRYEIEREIGRGSNGCVYLARDRLLSSEEGTPALVAVKIIRPGRSSGAPAESEARRMRLVEHRNVVRVSDVGRTDNGCSYIVQEYVRGSNLGQVIDKQRLSVRSIVKLIADVADGVQAIHAAGLVHHDLKPQNILVGEDSTVRVTDFGSSTWQWSRGAGRASTGAGTLAFMAPEMLRMLDVAPMPCSDVFSLGAVLFWAITGRPVAGDNPAEALRSLADAGDELDGVARRLRRAGVDRDLRLIIRRAVSVKLDARHPSAGAFAHDLRAWLARKPIAWTKPGPARRARLLVKRRPWTLAACGLIAVSLGAAGAAARSASRHAAAARASEYAAEIERAKYETEVEWKKKTAGSLRRLLTKFATVKKHGLRAEVLTSLWILEWSHGPMLLDNPEMLNQIWDARIGVLEKERAALLADGGNRAPIEARLLEPSLAMWYIRAGRSADAIRLLDESIPAWASICAPDDPWMHQLDVLRAAASVRLALDNNASAESVRDEIELLKKCSSSPEMHVESAVVRLARETLKSIPR